MLQWVVKAYLVTSAACIILGGKVADRCGAAAVSADGVAAFGIASVVIAVAPIAALVLAGRALPGLGRPRHPSRPEVLSMGAHKN